MLPTAVAPITVEFPLNIVRSNPASAVGKVFLPLADEVLQKAGGLQGHQPRFRGPVVDPREGFCNRIKRRQDLAKECKQITMFMSNKNNKNSRVTLRRVSLKSA